MESAPKAQLQARTTPDKGYVLRLFVAGNERKSRLARENLASICREYLADHCTVEVVDVLLDFKSALDCGIFLTPALLVVWPHPTVTIFGTLSDHNKIIDALRLSKDHD